MRCNREKKVNKRMCVCMYVRVCTYLKPIFFDKPSVAFFKSLAHVHQFYSRLYEALCVASYLSAVKSFVILCYVIFGSIILSYYVMFYVYVIG